MILLTLLSLTFLGVAVISYWDYYYTKKSKYFADNYNFESAFENMNKVPYLKANTLNYIAGKQKELVNHQIDSAEYCDSTLIKISQLLLEKCSYELAIETVKNIEDRKVRSNATRNINDNLVKSSATFADQNNFVMAIS